MKTYRDVKRTLLKNPETRRAYNTLAPEYGAISAVIELRLTNHLSQKELAEKLHTKQSALSRFERGMVNPTVGFLAKIATAFGKKLEISFK